MIRKAEKPEVLINVKKIIKSLAYDETIELLKKAELQQIENVLQKLQEEG